MKKIVLLFALLGVLAGCGTDSGRLVGTWVQPVPGQPGLQQGIRLEKGGKASSVNMHTLVYEHWRKNGNQLILTGKSIGNGQTLLFSDTLQIGKLTATTLILKKGEYTAEYTRSETDRPEVSDTHTAANSLDYEGTYKGTFPAADCPGIKITLTLGKDSAFTQNSVYIDRKDGMFDEKGTYTVSGNLLTLQPGDGVPEYYRIEENRLRRLDKNKQDITGELADYYILRKEQML